MVRVKRLTSSPSHRLPPSPFTPPHHLSHGFLFVLVFDEYISPRCYFVLVFDESTLRFDFHCVSISPPHPLTILTLSPFSPPHPLTILTILTILTPSPPHPLTSSTSHHSHLLQINNSNNNQKSRSQNK